MDTTPPTPETTASMFVWALTSMTAFTVVLVLLVVRRRGDLRATLGLCAMVLLVLAATGLNLIVPAQIRSAENPATLISCPYDRLAWSNMPPNIEQTWLPCRRAARLQLAATLGGGAVLTVLAAGALLRSRPAKVPAARLEVEASVGR
ncbi:MAG TPA: hypothetical protein VEQ66_02835 [Propionibacteriaceae bacterium]|nr:hypothetical protein [Propionibacteriaceae bacterium]